MSFSFADESKSPTSHSHTETIIKPTTKRNVPPAGDIPLHGLDLLMPKINVPLALVFRITPPAANVSEAVEASSAFFGGKFESVVAKLKASLAETLEVYPPVAGTIHISPDDESEQTLVCDGRGAMFMTQIEDRPYVEKEHWLSGSSGVEFIPRDNAKPLFSAKLTLFSCGTIVMIVALHHYVADLTSYMDFINDWARSSRGEDSAIHGTWSRNFSKVAATAIPPTIPGIMVVPPSSDPPPMPALRMADALRWSISEENLRKLKTDLTALISTENLPLEHSWMSSADALTALIWGAMTRAQNNIPTKTNMFSSDDLELDSLGVATASGKP